MLRRKSKGVVAITFALFFLKCFSPFAVSADELKLKAQVKTHSEESEESKKQATSAGGANPAPNPSPTPQSLDQLEISTYEPSQNFEWESGSPPDVTVSHSDFGDAKFSVQLKWKAKKEGWSFLNSNYRSIPLNESDQTYEINVPLQGPRTHQEVIAISPRGKVHKENIEVSFPNFRVAKDQLSRAPRLWFAPYLGVSNITLNQTMTPSLTLFGITAELDARYALRRNVYDLGFQTSMTLLPFGSSWSGVSVRWLDAHLHLTRHFEFDRSPLSLSFSAGALYSTLFVKDQLIGFQNLTGIELFPTFKYCYADRDLFSLIFKYSPLTDEFDLLSLSNRELDIQLEWQRKLPGKNLEKPHQGRFYSVRIEYKSVNLKGQSITQMTDFSAHSFLLFGGYHW